MVVKLTEVPLDTKKPAYRLRRKLNCCSAGHRSMPGAQEPVGSYGLHRARNLARHVEHVRRYPGQWKVSPAPGEETYGKVIV